jgi:predicted ATPase
MVGRDRELARVTGFLDDALAGRGCLVLCTGEAGIGKTRLAEEVAAAAAARGVPVAWARAADRDSLPPYGLWQLVLDEPAVRGAGDDPSGAGLWSRVFGDAERPALADGTDSGSAQRFAMFAEVRRRLAQAARPSGLLLVLDDLQWTDEASAVLLADVVRQLRGTLILVLATYRESAASGDTSAGLPASADQAGEVRSETGGNPFLVRELARMLAEQRRGGPVPVPGRVAEATVHRLAQLSDPARALVQTAAVAGNNFSVGVVAKILAVPVLSLLGAVAGVRGGRAPVPAGAIGRWRGDRRDRPLSA